MVVGTFVGSVLGAFWGGADPNKPYVIEAYGGWAAYATALGALVVALLPSVFKLESPSFGLVLGGLIWGAILGVVVVLASLLALALVAPFVKVFGGERTGRRRTIAATLGAIILGGAMSATWHIKGAPVFGTLVGGAAGLLGAFVGWVFEEAEYC
jgi:hypothetical protein